VPASRNKESVWALVEDGYNLGRAEVAHQVCHPEYLNESVIRSMPRGPAGAADHIRLSHGAIAGMTVRIFELIGEGDTVAALRQIEGRSGTYLGASGAQGGTSQWSIVWFGLERGLIRSHVSNWEALRALVQSGSLPVRAAAGADLSSLELPVSRRRDDLRHATREEAVVRRPDSARERAHNAQLLERVLRYQYGAGNAAPEPGAISAQARLSFADFGTQHGADGLRLRREAFAGAFSDVRIETRSLVVEEGRAVARWELSCAQSGPYLGLPASGRRATATGSSYARIVDGTIVDWVDILDALRLLRMVGALAALLPGCYPDQ
jgi:predicted ester cyclase